MVNPNYMVETYKKVVYFKILKDRLLESDIISEIGSALLKQANDNPRVSLVLDFEKVTHMSSSMIGKLIATHKTVVRDKGRFAMGGVGKPMMEILKATKLHKVLNIKKTAQVALAEYQRKPL